MPAPAIRAGAVALNWPRPKTSLPDLDPRIERRAGPDVPVGADDVVATQLLGVAGELVIVFTLRDRVVDQRRVRQREQVQHLPAHRMDHVLRNDVAREAAGAAGVHVARRVR